MPVGGQQGNVYKTREGFGKAFILPTQNTYAQANAVAQKNLAKKKPKLNRNEITKGIRDGKAEWWISHNKELSDEFNGLLDYAADIMEAGADPTKGSDKASGDWQKKWADLNNKAEKSMQVKNSFEKGKAIIDKDKKSKLDDAFIEKFNDYHGRPLADLMEKGDLPPDLRYKPDPYAYTDALEKDAKALRETNPELPPEDIKKHVASMLADPTKGQHIRDIHQPVYDAMTDIEKADADAMANQLGFSDYVEHVLYRDYEALLGVEPLDYDEIIKNTMPGTHTEKSSYESMDNVTTGKVDKAIPTENAETRAKKALETYPQMLEYLKDKGLATDMKSAIKYVAEDYQSRATTEHSTSTSRLKDEDTHGYGRKKVEKNAKFYDQAIRLAVTSTPTLGALTEEEQMIGRRAAAAYAHGTGSFPGGGKIVATTKEGKETGGQVIKKSGEKGAKEVGWKGAGFPLDPTTQLFEVFYEGEEVSETTTVGNKRVTTKKRPIKSKVYSLDPNSPDVLKEGETYGWHGEAFKKSGKLFTEVYDEAILNHRNQVEQRKRREELDKKLKRKKQREQKAAKSKEIEENKGSGGGADDL